MNKANTTDPGSPFLDLHISIANGFVSSKTYDKRDDFDVDIVNFPILDVDVPCRASCGVNLLGLLVFDIMLRTSTREINVKWPNFSSSAIGIIIFEQHILNFITDTLN